MTYDTFENQLMCDEVPYTSIGTEDGFMNVLPSVAPMSIDYVPLKAVGHQLADHTKIFRGDELVTTIPVSIKEDPQQVADFLYCLENPTVTREDLILARKQAEMPEIITEGTVIDGN